MLATEISSVDRKCVLYEIRVVERNLDRHTHAIKYTPGIPFRLLARSSRVRNRFLFSLAKETYEVAALRQLLRELRISVKPTCKAKSVNYCPVYTEAR
jgi:hypothetical protein